MPQKTNNFEKFWKELKRRKVVHVITVYVAIAFGILQLIDIISPSLHWPEWTMTFVFVVLCIGFIIAVFLSWVYDITPAGVKKTKPAGVGKHVELSAHPVSGGWKIATFISGVIIVALVAFNFITRSNFNADISKLEKSIAVLPFINESPVDSNKHFINGVMEEILNNLQTIKELRVLARTSTSQYQDLNRPTIPEIAKKLRVSYIVEGSGQKYGNTFTLRVQLIRAKGKETHLWGKTYNEEIRSVGDYVRIQSEVAQAIAAELKEAITPEEKQLIEKIPTNNSTAYELYRLGQYFLERNNIEDVKTALKCFERAKAIDPEFASAYASISDACIFLRSGGYGDPVEFAQRAMDEARKALELDSTLAEAHCSLATMKTYIQWDWCAGESGFKKAIELKYNFAKAHAYYAHLLNILGRQEEALKHGELSVRLDPDNPFSISCYAMDLLFKKQYDNVITVSNEALSLDTNALTALAAKAYSLHLTGRFEAAFKVTESLYTKQYPNSIHVFAQDLSKAGYADIMRREADTLAAQSKSNYVLPTDIAYLYNVAGDEQQTIEFLEQAYVEKDPNLLYLLLPIYDNIRDEPRFQEIAREMNLPYNLKVQH